ncbi:MULTISPECIES: F0F1 ATP synthase subunit delta [unclassified Chelatococcus]|jgi:F-type H+-transporting ATPase subunit delta|uniref:F0F1 ATP synthase subunit delta n=1 Tax=unclassified Chelatococcus TaxID=2638111 RepID=UPI0020BED6B9|nr:MULTISPECIES: F0F1 ATP synthase subunit delta [unclassified Chelatococcus]MCO5078283.1 F0F1 ATP synthase subunit delta [Chelatococcus sp.]CAH1656042.1 ATP synthase subunit delta [Hyphomicrobiales bacterium]CAH1684876.1 ATP synthase subunit delta [Hyphomicrobiales bacterium]
MVSGVAERYAKALLDLAEEAKAVDAVGADLDRFSGLIAESPDLARLVKSPVFSAEEQEKAVTAILAKAGIGGLTANFIRLVASKRRLFALPGMIEAYKSLVADKKGIVRAEVTLAEQPSPKMLADIEAALKDVAGGSIALNVKVNPAIIGGLIVKLGSRMIDASLRSKLNSIRLALKEVG